MLIVSLYRSCGGLGLKTPKRQQQKLWTYVTYYPSPPPPPTPSAVHSKRKSQVFTSPNSFASVSLICSPRAVSMSAMKTLPPPFRIRLRSGTKVHYQKKQPMMVSLSLLFGILKGPVDGTLLLRFTVLTLLTFNQSWNLSRNFKTLLVS